MLDRRTSKLLQFIVGQCTEGAYKVVNKKDIINAMPKRYNMDNESIEQIISYLSDRNYVDVKYSDEAVFCVSALPKARVASEEENNVKQEKNFYKKLIGIGVALMFLSALVGSIIGTIVTNLFM